MAVVTDVGAVAAPAEATSGPQAPARVKFFYSFGQVVESGYLTINTFVFFYYTAVLGLSGGLVGAAVAISMTLDAVFDPFIGAWSDRVRSRFGRRLPVMLVGAPLTMLTMGLLFAPPSGLTPLLLFVWLTATKMGVRAFASMYNIPFYALGGELSQDYVERSRIVAYRLLAGIVTSVTVTAFAYSVFFAGEGGLQRPERYPPFGWTIGTVVLVFSLICCAGVWRHAAALPQPTHAPGSMRRELLSGMGEMLRNRSFLILFLSLLLFSSAAGLNQALNTHAAVFVWQLRPEKIQVLFYIYLFGIFVGTPLTPVLLRWMEKKTANILGFVMVIAAWIVVPGLRASGVIAPTGDAAIALLLPTNFIVGLGSGIIFIAYPSMMADAAEEHEQLFGQRREGLFFSGLGFGGKAAAGMGALLGGVTLDLLHFPREVGRQVHAVIAPDVLSGLIAGWGLAPAVLSVIGALVFLPYAINRRRHAEIVVAVQAQRAAQRASEARSS